LIPILDARYQTQQAITRLTEGVMENKLDICGRRVGRACKHQDYIQLFFADGSILNIFNRIIGGELNNDFLGSLANTTVSTCVSKEGSIVLQFSNGQQFEVGMIDADYSSPEALEFIGEDGRRIVWN
jgi:hypothetical protein